MFRGTLYSSARTAAAVRSCRFITTIYCKSYSTAQAIRHNTSLVCNLALKKFVVSLNKMKIKGLLASLSYYCLGLRTTAHLTTFDTNRDAFASNISSLVFVYMYIFLLRASKIYIERAQSAF